MCELPLSETVICDIGRTEIGQLQVERSDSHWRPLTPQEKQGIYLTGTSESFSHRGQVLSYFCQSGNVPSICV